MSEHTPRQIEGFDVMAGVVKIMKVPIYEGNPPLSVTPRGMKIEFDQESVVFEGHSYVGSRRTYFANGLPLARLTTYNPPSGRDMWDVGVPHRLLSTAYELTGVDIDEVVSLRTEVVTRKTTPLEQELYGLKTPRFAREHILLIQRAGIIFNAGDLPLEEHRRMQSLFNLPK